MVLCPQAHPTLPPLPVSHETPVDAPTLADSVTVTLVGEKCVGGSLEPPLVKKACSTPASVPAHDGTSAGEAIGGPIVMDGGTSVEVGVGSSILT